MVFKSGDGNWIDILSTTTKKDKNRIRSSTKLTPTQASLKKNEGYIYQNLFHKRKKLKPKFQKHDLRRTANLEKTFSKGDMTNSDFYKITEINSHTISSYKIDNLPEPYIEVLLKKTNLSLKEKVIVMKKVNLN